MDGIREFERVRTAIWVIDPLGVAEDRDLVPDEYDSLAWAMLATIRHSTDDTDIDAAWNRLLDELVGTSTPTGYFAALHAYCTHSFARFVRGEVSYHTYPRA